MDHGPATVATVAKQLFEDRRVRIPAGNAVLRADLHKIKKVVSATGHPRLVADRIRKVTRTGVGRPSSACAADGGAPATRASPSTTRPETWTPESRPGFTGPGLVAPARFGVIQRREARMGLKTGSTAYWAAPTKVSASRFVEAKGDRRRGYGRLAQAVRHRRSRSQSNDAKADAGPCGLSLENQPSGQSPG